MTIAELEEKNLFCLELKPVMFVLAQDYISSFYDDFITIYIINKVDLMTEKMKTAFTELTYCSNIEEFIKKCTDFPYFKITQLKYKKMEILLSQVRLLAEMNSMANTYSINDLEQCYPEYLSLLKRREKEEFTGDFVFLGSEEEFKSACILYQREMEAIDYGDK